MAPRLPLNKLCESQYILEYQPDAIHRLLKAGSARLFNNLSTRIFHHADQHGRDTILRALSLSAAHLELDKLFSPLRDADINEIFSILVPFKVERVQEDPGDLRSAQDAAFPPLSIPERMEGEMCARNTIDVLNTPRTESVAILILQATNVTHPMQAMPFLNRKSRKEWPHAGSPNGLARIQEQLRAQYRVASGNFARAKFPGRRLPSAPHEAFPNPRPEVKV
ncbi:MAG: hypothetical protein Q9193_002127 [Seirophora villosa]